MTKVDNDLNIEVFQLPNNVPVVLVQEENINSSNLMVNHLYLWYYLNLHLMRSS